MRLASQPRACQDAKVITNIIAIDPGLANGCAHVAVRPEGFSIVSTDELAPIETGEWLIEQLASLSMPTLLESTAVIIERFTITQKTAQNSQAPWSLEVIGQTRWILSRWMPDDELIVQNVADSKAAFTNDRLRAYGLWHKGGAGHAVEALRHVALFAHRARILPRQG